jgi:CRISPR system Cascade subunit CasD
MPTLLLLLAGPMQSWGTSSRFTIRDTGLEPSKSGVIGLLCAALGKPRQESTIDDPEFRWLVELKMGVRVDREGVMRVDYHTAQSVAIAGGGKPKETEVSWRYYLSDACFLIALEGDDERWLRNLNDALARPRWPLSLGRKAFLPSRPVRVSDELHAGSLLDALKNFDWQGGDGRREPPERIPKELRIVIDATPHEASEVRHDLPLSFALGQRRFTLRYIKTDFIPRPQGGANGQAVSLPADSQSA